MYLNPKPPHSLHSIILIGIQNIARLNLGRSSPFNIAYQQRLNGFSLDEVREMMAQYTAESGQQIEEDALTMLYEQTAGHPFLINRAALILTEEIATDRAQPVTVDHLRRPSSAMPEFIKMRFFTFSLAVPISLIRTVRW